MDAARSFLRGVLEGLHRVMLRRFVIVEVAATAVRTGLLGVLVQWEDPQDLLAAVLAIGVSGRYRSALDSTWTSG